MINITQVLIKSQARVCVLIEIILGTVELAKIIEDTIDLISVGYRKELESIEMLVLLLQDSYILYDFINTGIMLQLSEPNSFAVATRKLFCPAASQITLSAKYLLN